MNTKILSVVMLSLLPCASFAVGNAANGKAIVSSNKCEGCHGSFLISTNNNPSLAGQKEAYVIEQLQAFKAGQRTNSLMSPQAAKLSDQDIQDLAAYIPTLATLPTYSANFILALPMVKVINDFYQAELQYDPAIALFSIKSLTKR